MPLRYAYVDDAPGGNLPANTDPIAPFSDRECESAALSAYDLGGQPLADVDGTELALCSQTPGVKFRRAGADSELVVGDEGVLVNSPQSGTVVLELGGTTEAPRLNRPDLNQRCVRGLPIWVLSTTGYDNNGAQPGRVATYPESRTGTGGREIVDC
jgi:hypothetical protein